MIQSSVFTNTNPCISFHRTVLQHLVLVCRYNWHYLSQVENLALVLVTFPMVTAFPAL